MAKKKKEIRLQTSAKTSEQIFKFLLPLIYLTRKYLVLNLKTKKINFKKSILNNYFKLII